MCEFMDETKFWSGSRWSSIDSRHLCVLVMRVAPGWLSSNEICLCVVVFLQWEGWEKGVFKLYEVVEFSSQMLIDVYLSKHILKLRSEVFLSDEWGQVHSFHMQQVTTGQFACIAECYSVFFLSILLNFLPTSNKDSYFCALKSDFSSVLMPKSTFFVAILWKSVIPYFPYHLTYCNCDVISPSGSTLHCATLPVKMPACAVLVFPSFITLWNAYGLLGQKEVISRCQGGLYNGQEKLYLNPK